MYFLVKLWQMKLSNQIVIEVNFLHSIREMTSMMQKEYITYIQ